MNKESKKLAKDLGDLYESCPDVAGMFIIKNLVPSVSNGVVERMKDAIGITVGSKVLPRNTDETRPSAASVVATGVLSAIHAEFGEEVFEAAVVSTLEGAFPFTKRSTAH